MAGLHGTDGVCVVALHGAPFGLDAQLYPVVRGGEVGRLGEDRPVGTTEILWDSIRPV